MDDKDNKNVGDGRNNAQNGNSDYVIWQKASKTRKKSYIYEVPHEQEPVDEEPKEKIWGQEKKKDDVLKAGAKDASNTAGQDAFNSSGQDASNSAGWDASKNAAKDAADEAPEEIIWNGSKSGNSDRSREGVKKIRFDEAAEEADKKAVKEARAQEQKKRAARRAREEQDMAAYEADASESKKDRRKKWRGRVIEGTETQDGAGKRFFRFLGRNRGRIFLLIVFLAVVIGGGTIFNRMRTYKKFSVDWQVSATDTGYSDYTAFGNLILHYSQDGVSASNTSGELLWNQAYNMDVPAVSIRDGYVVIYDVKGKDFYICDADGCTGHGTTDKKILKGEISASGVVALVLDDKKANYIEYYRKDGSQIEVEIKTLITGDGYPLDIAVSPDGEELMTSYIYASDGKMLSEVVFRNFEVGKNESDRVVGGFKNYEESLVPDVLFFDDDSSAAVTEKSIDFYSTSNALKPKLVKTQSFDETITSVTANDSYIAVVLKNEDTEETEAQTQAETTEDTDAETEAAETTAKASGTGSNGYTLKVFDQNGKKVFTDTIDFTYDKVEFSGNGLLVYNSTTCAVYDMSGVKKFQGSLDVEIEGVMRFGETTLVVHGNGALQKITLK